jgi:hypothetical protein
VRSGSSPLALGILTALVLLAAASTARATVSAVAGAPDRDALLAQVVTELQVRDSGSDARYFNAGIWMGRSTDCWPCRVGPAVGAAASAEAHPELLSIVVATMDRGIADQQRSDGSFGDPINTTWFANALGTSYLLVASRIDPATAARWSAAVARAADHLIATGHLAYYVNGNINLSITTTMWLAARITGDPRYAQAYETSLAFTLSPPQAQWPGFGLHATGAGTGYLAESNGGTPGLDPVYGQLQVDVASNLYVVSRDPRILELLSTLVNGVLPLVDGQLLLDGRNGTRRGGQPPFLTPAIDLLVGSGSRPDLALLDAAQFGRLRNDYAVFLTTSDGGNEPAFYRGVGTWLAVPVMDARYRAATAPVLAAAPSVPAQPVKKRARISACARDRRAAANRPGRKHRVSRACRRERAAARRARARARARAKERRERRAAERRREARRRHR